MASPRPTSATHSTIHGFVTGDYVSPAGARLAGQRVVAVAYLVRHPEANLLFDTGFPFDEPFSVEDGNDAVPTFPQSLEEGLARLGTPLSDVDLVVNCHLHIDHAGGNFRLPADLPIYAQAVELELARAETEPLVIDALALDRQAYRALGGQVDILPGVRALPTPGHTAGHHSLVVDTQGGPVVLLGQGMPSASEFAAAAYAVTLEAIGSQPVPPYPAWLPDILAVEPARVHFAHDLAIWQPGA
ncbi:MAG TPA: MBL fold metallo-hydrolase [Candidatus Limnocylindria bacterium]